MITIPKLSSAMVPVVYEAAAGIGFSRNQIFLQDYDESFYYYVMNHRKDNCTRKIGWFLFDNNQVSFARLNYWGNYPKFFVSMMKAFFGDKATAENSWGFDWLPKWDKGYDVLQYFEMMKEDDERGQGQWLYLPGL